ncbi:MAG: hypothetical protein OXC11_03890 [Rhodospirillales bacterium]|nr:hypothetical protein [Rhodospirillales bacterium]
MGFGRRTVETAQVTRRMRAQIAVKTGWMVRPCEHCLGRGEVLLPAKRADADDRITGFCPNCYGFDQLVRQETDAERRVRRRGKAHG